MFILDQHSNIIKKLCVSHKVKRLYAFGSVLTDRFNSESDIDLIVDFDAMEMEEWLEYLRVHEPKAYWGLLLAFTATTIFCVWLMFKIIGPAFPPKEPPCLR